MSTPPRLFDTKGRQARLSRAAHRGEALFLQELARDLVEERLSEVNKSFTKVAIVGPWADRWLVTPGPMAKATAIPDHETLDLPPDRHDLVVHALGLHQHNDPVGQLIQMRRALKPDGMALTVMFGGQTLFELRAVLATAEAEIRGGMAQRVAPMGEIRDLGSLLQRAGLALPVADSHPQRVSYRDLHALIHDLRAMGEAGFLASHRPGLTRQIVARADALYREHYPAEDGRITATFELVFLTGWAPAPGQQQPLRPGSAAARLADALGTVETPAGDKAQH